MSEYISKEIILENVLDQMTKSTSMLAMSERIKNLQEADVVERKHGKWIYQFHEDEVGVTCSECEGYAESFAKWIYDEGYRIDYNFCPNCGAQMDGDSDV